jgi:hypothetical protein
VTRLPDSVRCHVLWQLRTRDVIDSGTGRASAKPQSRPVLIASE